MIPLQLTLRNFMCYRGEMPPLNFEGIHLACLTGANGHGKSALLDAMTWALWGRARAKRDDELIHLGESEMEVEFTFELSGTVYRVVRKRDSAKRGTTVLDLQVQVPDGTGTFRSIAEAGIRATEEAIVRLLRMDYDTFTSSSFLLQGKADAFTTRSPGERKQVLADILGLSLYDGWEQRAKEKAREKEREAAELEALLRDIDRELARQPEYEAEAAQSEGRVLELNQRTKEADEALRGLRHDQQAIEHQQARLRDMDRRLAQAQQELGEVEAQLAERGQRLAGYETALAQRQQVEEGYAALVRGREAVASCNERLALHARLQEQRQVVQRGIDAARHEVELGLGRLTDQTQELTRRADEQPEHERTLTEVRTRLTVLSERQAEREAAQARLRALGEEGAGLKVRNEQWKADMEALKERMELLESTAGEAACPLCGQALTTVHREQLLAQFRAEGKALADGHRANSARQREIANEAQKEEARVRELERELAQQAAQQRREAQAEQALAEAQHAAEQLQVVEAERAAVAARLGAGEYALAEQADLLRLTNELLKVGYDGKTHEQARNEAEALEPFDEAQRRLQAALERIDDERTALTELRTRHARWAGALVEDRSQRITLAAEVERLPGVVAEVLAQAQALEEIQAQSLRARQALGAAQQKVQHCHYLATERERHEAKRRQRVEEKAVFEELRLAFGKKGIQAMIIEAAIPEIEYEANHLLARMTEGRMHVRFETQRETLKGDTLETLDIQIADELGTRAYETFSGGEAFRVNFAIRIALSKLLARRAGAQLQTLVIDEGFGTQDAEGRERLVEAITSIQDDFARVLVITHIEELKDAFPVRIEVTKTADGAHFRVT